MTRNKNYLKWLARKVNIDMSQNVDTSYVQLMNALYEKEFYSVIDMDSNRIEDALALREEYSEYIQNDLCSLLEIMVALAVRCEAEYLRDIATAGNIFWDMLDNLGLCQYTDMHFDRDEVDCILDRLLDREYESDGAGGLFYAGNDSKIDMRNEEIWWQMQIYAMRKYEQIDLF